MAQSLPLEVFADRKIKKWQARAKELDVRLVDGVGVAPVEEMMYFWNGYKRMADEDYEKSLIALRFGMDKEGKVEEAVDEGAVRALLTSIVLRNKGDMEGAKKHMKVVLGVDRYATKGGLRDDWSSELYSELRRLWRGG